MNWKHKISELFFEVLIIVFAVSVSLLLERWREKAQDHVLEKEFLEGLKSDLISDIKEMEGDSSSYSRSMRAYTYFIKNAGQPMEDSAQIYINSLYSSTSFQANNSRFEGLKSSGKLDIIENAELRNMILLLYQENIPSLVTTTEIFLNTSRTPLVDLLDHEINLTSKSELTKSISKTLSGHYPQNILTTRKGFIAEILARYKESLRTARKIVLLIDEADRED